MNAATREPALFIVRHGDTEWSENGRHTGSTDLPLLPEGREHARALRAALSGLRFGRVLSSPLLRARETCELAGLGEQMEICAALREWDYGDYEGLTSVEIHARRPSWDMWRDGCPHGESPQQVAARADAVIALAVAPTRAAGAVAAAPAGAAAGEVARGVAEGAAAGIANEREPLPTICFAHGHILRVLTARWIAMDAAAGERFALAAGGLAKLGHEHATRVIERWNA